MNIDKMSRQQADNARWSALMASAQMGSKSDYQQLLTELANVIHAYLRKHLGNQDFLEDCVQDTLIAIHQARHTYDPKRSFRPWLFTIVRHKLIDHLRHKTTNQRVIQHQHHQEAIRQQGEQPGVVEASIDNNSLLNTLSVLNREALTRTKLLGFTCAETAKQLGISESAVKVRVHRAINKLRQVLEDEE
ncbi:sigma-70 family RNA polymerase sigma factor [Thalassotalea fusca]